MARRRTRKRRTKQRKVKSRRKRRTRRKRRMRGGAPCPPTCSCGNNRNFNPCNIPVAEPVGRNSWWQWWRENRRAEEGPQGVDDDVLAMGLS